MHSGVRDASHFVSWPDRIELALRTAAGTAYAMLPGGPAGTMCSESLWVANPELPLLCLPGPYQNVGAQEQRGLCSGVRDLAGASPYGARRWPFPTAIYWLEIPHSWWAQCWRLDASCLLAHAVVGLDLDLPATYVSPYMTPPPEKGALP